jgi:hypothetical protein
MYNSLSFMAQYCTSIGIRPAMWEADSVGMMPKTMKEIHKSWSWSGSLRSLIGYQKIRYGRGDKSKNLVHEQLPMCLDLSSDSTRTPSGFVFGGHVTRPEIHSVPEHPATSSARKDLRVLTCGI